MAFTLMVFGEPGLRRVQRAERANIQTARQVEEMEAALDLAEGMGSDPGP